MLEALVDEIIEKLNARLAGNRPELAHFDLTLDDNEAPGVIPFLKTMTTPNLGDLLVNPSLDHPNMPLICLLLIRLKWRPSAFSW